jgi:hypothetical protein
MEKNLNVNDLKPSLSTQELKLTGINGEEVILQCESVDVTNQEVIINSVLTEFDSFSYDLKIKALKALYFDGFTNLDPFHTLEEKNLIKAIDLIPDEVMWNLESVGFYVELERNFKQEFALRREYENSSSFGAQLIVMFLTDIVQTLAEVQNTKAKDASNEAHNLLEKLNTGIKEGQYDNVLSLFEKMENSQKSLIKE